MEEDINVERRLLDVQSTDLTNYSEVINFN